MCITLLLEAKGSSIKHRRQAKGLILHMAHPAPHLTLARSTKILSICQQFPSVFLFRSHKPLINLVWFRPSLCETAAGLCAYKNIILHQSCSTASKCPFLKNKSIGEPVPSWPIIKEPSLGPSLHPPHPPPPLLTRTPSINIH